MSVVRYKPGPCLNCHKLMDVIGDCGDGKTPHPGAVTICLYCGAVMKIGPDYVPEGFTEQEIDEMLADIAFLGQLARLNSARQKVMFVHRSRN